MRRVHSGARPSGSNTYLYPPIKMRIRVRLLTLGAALCQALGSGALTAQQRGPFSVEGQVRGADERPLARISVFLDRGDNLVERYETDSLGAFRFSLWVNAPHRAVWLICPPSANPIIGMPEHDEFSRRERTIHHYQASTGRDSTYRFYRQRGWSGPIPRECPQSQDLQGWRYPASAGMHWGAYSTVEPDWRRFPGPPALPTPR